MSLHRKDSEGAKPTKRSRRKKGPIYVASVKDYSDKRGARGGVYDLSRPQNDQLIFTVWGSDLKEMRQRKHWLVEVLKKEQSPQPGTEDIKTCTAKDSEGAKKTAKNMISDARKNARFIQKMRKLGASTSEIAKALGISEDDVALS